MLSRSQFVKAAATAAALGPVALPLTACAQAQAQIQARRSGSGSRRIVVASDPHYVSPRLTDNGAAFASVVTRGDGKVMLHSEDLLDAFVAQVLAEKPAALVVSGDLTFNGARLSHEDLAAKLVPLLDAGVRVAVLPGNHDVACLYAARFAGVSYEYVDSVGAAEFREIWARFGYDDALAEDDASLSYVCPLFDDTWLLMVDCNGCATPGSLAPETLAFCRSVVARAREEGVRVVGVSHQNLLQHCALFKGGFVMGEAQGLAELYGQEGVSLNLSGHIHIQHTVQAGPLLEAATSSLAVTPCQYTQVSLEADGRYEARCVPVDVEGWARSIGSDDPDLLEFSTYAEDFFDNCTRVQPYGELVESGLAEAEAHATARAIQVMNRRYFAGRTDLIDWDEPALVAAFGRTSLEAYLQVVRAEEPRDHACYGGRIGF